VARTKIFSMTTAPCLELRRGVPEPVVRVILRRQVKTVTCFCAGRTQAVLATREDAWLYRNQMALVVGGYNDDS